MQKEIEEFKRHARIFQLSLDGLIRAMDALALAIEARNTAPIKPETLAPLREIPAGQMLSAGEVAKVLGVKAQTLAKWRATKLDGPAFVKVGGRVRYRWGDVQRYISSRTTSTWGSDGE